MPHVSLAAPTLTWESLAADRQTEVSTEPMVMTRQKRGREHTHENQFFTAFEEIDLTTSTTV